MTAGPAPDGDHGVLARVPVGIGARVDLIPAGHRVSSGQVGQSGEDPGHGGAGSAIGQAAALVGRDVGALEPGDDIARTHIGEGEAQLSDIGAEGREDQLAGFGGGIGPGVAHGSHAQG